MGAPELPTYSGEEDVSAAHHAPPIIPSDEDSDDDGQNDYDGYQPLSMGGDETMDTTDNIVENHLQREEHEGDMESVLSNGGGDPNLPYVESADAEIERQVWSVPRPEVLQIELDNDRTAQILSAMANFTLPNAAVPEWAAGVSEEHWKEELLQRIRQRKEMQVTHSDETTTK